MAINKSTLRTVDILELIANNNDLTLTEISEALKIPPASTSDILQALLSKQMVEIANQRARTYKIGVKNFLIGNAYLANINIVEIAAPFIAALSEQTKNTVFLAKIIDSSIVYLHKVEPKDTFVSTCQIGSRAGLSVTALGKVILAYNEWLQEKVFATPLPKITEYSITDAEQLKVQLSQIRQQKYASDKFEYDERISCVGFPIFDQRGRVEHSISISGSHFESRDMEREIELGIKCAKEISMRLGFLEQ